MGQGWPLVDLIGVVDFFIGMIKNNNILPLCYNKNKNGPFS